MATLAQSRREPSDGAASFLEFWVEMMDVKEAICEKLGGFGLAEEFVGDVVLCKRS